MPAGCTYGLFVTIVGSHMWGMQTEQSDVDLALTYIIDSDDFLSGYQIPTKKNRKFQSGEKEYDIQYYEIGHLVNLLLKGNVNAIWAVCSPVTYPLFEMNAISMDTAVSEMNRIFGEDVHASLKDMVEANLSKESYYSIRGMVESQYLDHKKRKDVMPHGKALKTCIRTCQFGIELLTKGKLVFAPTPNNIDSDNLMAEAERYITNLDEAMARSALQEKPPEKPFRDLLLLCRKAML